MVSKVVVYLSAALEAMSAAAARAPGPSWPLSRALRQGSFQSSDDTCEGEKGREKRREGVSEKIQQYRKCRVKYVTGLKATD